jgi:TPR repeat protein
MLTAQYNMGQMYRMGQGIRQDHKEAVKWFRLAAEQGDPYAKKNLARMLAAGRGGD